VLSYSKFFKDDLDVEKVAAGQVPGQNFFFSAGYFGYRSEGNKKCYIWGMDFVVLCLGSRRTFPFCLFCLSVCLSVRVGCDVM